MKEFVLDRSKWHRGQGGNGSALLRACDGKSCCLGLYLLANGVQPDNLLGVAYPTSSGLRGVLPATTEWTQSKEVYDGDHAAPGNCSLNVAIAVTNDNDKIDDDVREHRLCVLFAEAGVAVSFVDSASPSVSQAEKP